MAQKEQSPVFSTIVLLLYHHSCSIFNIFQFKGKMVTLDHNPLKKHNEHTKPISRQYRGVFS